MKNLSFIEFIRDADGVDPTFVDRLVRARVPIESLANLHRFCRERYPEQYPRDWRIPTPHMLLGREAMGALWGRYLKAAEAVPDLRRSEE